MKKLLCVVLCFLPAMVFAQCPFEGTWKTTVATANLSQKPYEFSVNNGIDDSKAASRHSLCVALGPSGCAAHAYPK